jgi:hypothetical protein
VNLFFNFPVDLYSLKFYYDLVSYSSLVSLIVSFKKSNTFLSLNVSYEVYRDLVEFACLSKTDLFLCSSNSLQDVGCIDCLDSEQKIVGSDSLLNEALRGERVGVLVSLALINLLM